METSPKASGSRSQHHRRPSEQNGSRFSRAAADFTKPSTRSRPRATEGEEDLEDELSSLDAVEHPLFDALQRDNTHIMQQRIFTPWKRTLFRLFESPTSSSSAFVIHVTSTGLIVFSAFITILETLPAFHATPSYVWFGIETSLVVLFTMEYIGRLLAHSETWTELLSWAGTFFAIIDLLAILPYYIMIMIRADTTTFFRFSILRTFRLLRVFRPFRYSNTILLTIEVMYVAVMRSKEALFALAFFVGMALVVFSTLLYFAERGTWDETLGTFVNSDGDPSQFESIPAAAWFVLVTITTVGYGEIIPRSFLGRLIAVPLLMFGLILIALPSFVLGREFSIVWETMGGTKMLRMSTQGQGPQIPQLEDDVETAERIGLAPGHPQETSPGRRVETAGAREVVFSAGVDSPESNSNLAYPPQRDSRTGVGRISRLRARDGVHGFESAGVFSPITGIHRRRRTLSDTDTTGISNMKLAENQQVLSAQLEELTRVIQNLSQQLHNLTDGTQD